jgi:glycine dehydrogenase
MNFLRRHIGSSKKQISEMYKFIGVNSQELINNVVPENIKSNFQHYPSQTEDKSLTHLKKIMNNNRIYHSMIGLDFNESKLPNVIKRNLLENPKWYTSYTPYQAEISQGRMESLFNYQTLISELTSLPVSNCSLLDVGSASTEALNLAYFSHREKKNKFFCSDKVSPYIIEILKTRAKVLDLDLIVDDIEKINIDENLFGFFFSYPDTYGRIELHQDIIKELNQNKTLVISHNDIMSLLLVKPPGDIGVDISLGSTQRFGLPLWNGGPHSSFFAIKDKYLRFMPGRIIGKSHDRNGMEAYRMALQTREQHIKKEKATSNICTAQALLANTSSMFAIYHGKENLINISKEIAKKALVLKDIISKKYPVEDYETFGSFLIEINELEKNTIFNKLLKKDIELRKVDNGLVICVNESTNSEILVNILEEFNINETRKHIKLLIKEYELGNEFRRDKNSFLNQKIFKEAKSETEMLRYMNSLADKDYSLVHGMIPLGSCTMKLNSVTEMEPLSWESVQNIHPYQEVRPEGYKEMIGILGNRLKDITGMEEVSFQPNAGSMGEYSGLLCISKYHGENGDNDRNICLIPESAHGTNFTSARLAGLKILKYSDNLSLDEFRELVEGLKEHLSCLMITYPNTYGVFDKNIKEIINIIHQNGGLVYMDGANMNAQCGITSPGECGADVCHLNLHKTFCIPHGGGGPGMGPILVNDKLKKYLPSNIYQEKDYHSSKTIGMISNSNYSSASILTIPHLYLDMVGSDGLREITESAILNANYLKQKLEDDYKIYSQNDKGFVGHEFIIDLREFKSIGITEKDIAKRLLDYSFHPPTMSWPILGSVMIEPTESESKEELDRFVDAMKSIREEIREIERGEFTKENNVLVNSPHPIKDIIDWKFDYSINKACFPLESLQDNKFWPSHSRIDDVYGDKNLTLKLVG